MRNTIVVHASVLHVVKIFVARNRAASERAVVDGVEESFLATGFHTRFDEVTHVGR